MQPSRRGRARAARVRLAAVSRCAAHIVVTLALVVGVAACSGDTSTRAATVRPSTTTTTTATTNAPSTTTSLPGRGSRGCGTPPKVTATQDATGDTVQRFDAAGRQRSYRFGVPKSYDEDEPAPLILNLHGAGSNAVQQSVYSRLPAEGAKRGYLVVTPDAVNANWELPGQGRDDEFLSALLTDIEANFCVDLDRVDAAGISLGAWKAAITACTHPDRFAAIALVAVEVAPANCAMPVVAFHGTADPVVPYGEGADPGVVVTGSNAGLPGAQVNMAKWARNARCAPDKRVEHIGADVEHWVYDRCRPGLDVEFYSIEHGGHTWPGSPIDVARLGATTHTIDATEIALDWFDAHRKRN
jgi:polyhydroxybutyrate depolymerase